MSDYNPELLQKPTDGQEVARQRLSIINSAVLNLRRAAESLGITDQTVVKQEAIIETIQQSENSIQEQPAEITEMHRAAQDAVAEALREAA